jgi:hypothetical protein
MRIKKVSLFDQEDTEIMTVMELVKAEKPKATRNRPRVLTARDMQVLTWIGEMYTVRFDLLQKLLSGGAKQTQTEELSAGRTYKLIQKWRDMGLAEYRRFLGDEPLYIWLTTKGLREVGLDYREQTPSLALIKHYHQVTLVRRYVELRHPDYAWQSERAIRGEVATIDARERKDKHVPDGVIVRPDTTRNAVEIELTRKGQHELEAIISGLAGEYPRTYYFVSEKTEPHIRELTEPYKGKFQIVPLSQVLREVGIEL